VEEPLRVVRTRGQTPLDALNELESVLTAEESGQHGLPHRPLRFSASTSAHTVPACAAAVTLTRKGFATIICTEAPMRAGVHHAEFVVSAESWCSVGIVRRGFDLSSAVRPSESKHGFGWTMNGTVRHSKVPTAPRCSSGAAWKAGDLVGLRLDLSRLTLTAFKNGERLGVFVSGADLAVSSDAADAWCWMVTMGHEGARVSIARRRPLSTHKEAAAAAFQDLQAANV